MRGILYVRFAEKARPVRAVISSLTGVLGTIRLRSHPNSKVPLTGAERTIRLSVKSKERKYGKQEASLRRCCKAALRGSGEKAISRGKSKTKTSPYGLVFVFREIIEFKFKRVYLRSFFIETSESDAI